MHIRAVVAVLATALLGCSSNWKLKETKSEMENSTRYSVVTESAREVKFEKGDPFRAPLSVTFEKDETSIRSGPGALIHFSGPMGRVDGARVETGNVKVRFDEEEPMQANMVEMPTTGSHFVFLGDEDDLLKNMLKHKTMKIQWVLVGGGTPIDTFKIEGLQEALLKLCGKAPAACKPNTPIGRALASVGVEVAGGGGSSSDQQSRRDTSPASPTPASPKAPDALSLPVGTFAATTPQWKAARDAVLAWCSANAGKCPDQAVQDLKEPADGVLEIGVEGALTTCSPGNCPGTAFVEFKKAGAAWRINKVEWAPMGD